MICQDIIEKLERLSPPQYACDWDNVGLLVGRREKEIRRILVALDATREVVRRAAEQEIDLLVTHHPMIFGAVKQVTGDAFVQDKILTLAENGICYYAMHTNFDTVGGMAELAAGPQYLNLSDCTPIEPCADGEGIGRYGRLPHPMTAQEAAAYVKDRFGLQFVMLYQSPEAKHTVYDTLAVLPGSGKSNMKQVVENGYTLYLTGDYGHHEGLDAMDMGLTVIDATHYGLEHIFISFIASFLREKLADTGVEVLEADPGCPAQIL